jgi:endonuclease/exonuclease/phosphatase family metal-dependent hydrolase
MRRLLLPAFLLLAAAPARPASAQDTLTVVSLNVWHDQHDWPARLAWMTEELAALRPDVVFLQEVLQHETLPNQAETLARALGLPHVHFVSVDSAGQARRYGNAILSARPFAATAERRLPPMDAYRIAAHARIEVAGRPVRLYTTHLHNPADVDGAGARAMEIVHLLDFVEATGGTDAPLVLGGDLNAEPGWPELRLLAPFRDAFAHLNPGAAGGTWGVAYNALPGRRIDYLFDAADARLVPVEAAVALDRPDAAGRFPSDHFAVYARYVLP